MSNYDEDPELQLALDTMAITVLGKELDGAHRDDDPHRARLRAAAVEICRRAGILEVLRAVSADGALRPPPAWPAADIVPIGGGPGWLRVAVRTFRGGRGVLEMPINIKIAGRPTQDQIGEAYERGYFQLKKWINA